MLASEITQVKKARLPCQFKEMLQLHIDIQGYKTNKQVHKKIEINKVKPTTTRLRLLTCKTVFLIQEERCIDIGAILQYRTTY